MDFAGISIMPHNDIYIDDTGNLAMAKKSEAIAQNVRQRLKHWFGEWYLKRDSGVEWMKYVMGAHPSNLDVAESLIKKTILKTPGVTQILEFSIRYDRSRGIKVERCVLETIYDEIEVSV